MRLVVVVEGLLVLVQVASKKFYLVTLLSVCIYTEGVFKHLHSLSSNNIMTDITIDDFIKDFANQIQDIEIMDYCGSDEPFYYEKSPNVNNNNNYYMIKNTNYEKHRFKKINLKLTMNDLLVDGNFIIVYAPFKRKLNKCYLNLKRRNTTTGRNIHRYNKMYSNVFYVNNKLKIIENISNRFIVFNKLTFSQIGINKSITITDDENCGLRIDSIVDCIRKISGKSIPAHVYTNNPIICELMVFIISKYLKRHMFLNIPQQCYYRNKVQTLVFYVQNLSNIYDIQNTTNKYPHHVKTRSCIIRNNDDDDDDDDDASSLYTFTDQSIIIVDNNYNDVKSPRVIINIPKNSINPKYFANGGNKKRKSKKNVADDHFVDPNHEIMNSIIKSFEYFSNEKIQKM